MTGFPICTYLASAKRTYSSTTTAPAPTDNGTSPISPNTQGSASPSLAFPCGFGTTTTTVGWISLSRDIKPTPVMLPRTIWAYRTRANRRASIEIWATAPLAISPRKPAATRCFIRWGGITGTWTTTAGSTFTLARVTPIIAR